MSGQAGFFDTDDRLRWLSAAGDPLERLRAVVDFEAFREALEAALPRADRSRGSRPPYDAVLMFRILVLQALYTLSDDRAEYQPAARPAELHALRRSGAAPARARRQDDLAVPRAADAGWRAGPAVRALRCHPRRAGLSCHGWPDRRCDHRRGAQAAAEQGREGDVARGRHARGLVQGAHPADRPRRALDHPTRPQGQAARGRRSAAGRRRDRRADVRLQEPRQHRPTAWLRAPLHGDPCGATRWQPARRGARSHQHGQRRLGRYRLSQPGQSRPLRRRGRTPQFRRAKPRGKPMPAHIARGNTTRSRVRAHVEHVFATEKRRMGLVIRCIGLVRATARITLANLAYNMRRLAWLEGREATA